MLLSYLIVVIDPLFFEGDFWDFLFQEKGPLILMIDNEDELIGVVVFLGFLVVTVFITIILLSLDS